MLITTGLAVCLFGIVFLAIPKGFIIVPDKQSMTLTSYRYPALEINITSDESSVLMRSLRWKRPHPQKKPSQNPDYIIIMRDERMLIWRTLGRGYLAREHLGFDLPPSACRCLDLPIARLETEAAERYGELMEWKEVQKYFPKYQTAEITDCVTGMKFLVQRRAGTYHADCQPLTLEDTRIMKKIYGGKWSWARRAIIVSTSGRRIAASMAGQPHGAGAIAGNGFPGHFCIHFWKSRVHRSGQTDLRHQREVLKASGSN